MTTYDNDVKDVKGLNQAHSHMIEGAKNVNGGNAAHTNSGKIAHLTLTDSEGKALCDADVRKFALDPSKSFIVQAPAGSGKTELLIQRFLTLLQFVKTPEEILAITFTKKAANEMRQRVIKALKTAAQIINDPSIAHVECGERTILIAVQVLKRDKELEWNLILNPNRLRIQTIDSLCSYITKSLPVLSHFGSQPNINITPYNLYQEAVENVLMHLEDEQLSWSNDIANLLTHLDNDLNKLSNLLVELLAKRDQWMQYIHLDLAGDSIKIALEKQLSKVIQNWLSALHTSFPRNLAEELLAILCFANSTGNLPVSSSQAKKASIPEISNDFTTEIEELGAISLEVLPTPLISNKWQWVYIAQFLLTKDFKWRKKVDKQIGFPTLSNIKNPIEKELHKSYRARFVALMESLQTNEELRLLLKEILLLPDAHYKDNQWNILKSLFQVLKIVCAELRLVFQMRGEIDFIENAQAALTALGNEDNPTDLLLAFDYSISHILIDEFQDTSSSQYQLLAKLIMGWEDNDGRSLFIVGDPMQSIYRFREAEVGLFIRMRTHGIGQLNLIPLTLTANFRSAKEIVDWNNAQFSKIFPSHDDIATGAVSYSPSVANYSDKSHSNISVPKYAKGVHIHPCFARDDSQQANKITDIILHEQHAFPNNTIAILVRSRTHLHAIIPALKNAEIPFHAINIDPFAKRQCIQDLVALTCALLHLADRISWLTILRSPWCGLTLNDLLIIIDDNPHNIIWEQLQHCDVVAKLSFDGQNRVKKLVGILQSQLNDKERYDLRTWIETTWFLIGGPATLSNKSEIEDAQAYFDLLSTLSHTNQIVNIDLLKENINSFYASTNAHADSCYVQLMTIHSAKGLEFDTVILPHLERKLPKDDKTLLNWLEEPLCNEESALLISALNAIDADKDALYEYIYRQKNLKSDYESDRLFYVATTRAKTNLHLLFNLEFVGDGGSGGDGGGGGGGSGSGGDYFDYPSPGNPLATLGVADLSHKGRGEVTGDYPSSDLSNMKRGEVTGDYPSSDLSHKGRGENLDGEIKLPAKGSFLAKIWEHLDLNQYPHTTCPLSSEESTNNLNGRGIKRLKSTWQNIITPIEKKLFFHHQQSGFMLRDNTATSVGTVIHIVLNKVANQEFGGINFWLTKSISQQFLLLRQLLLQVGMTALKIEPAIKSAHHAIDKCLHDSRGLWILKPHRDAQSEYAITAVIDNQIHRLVIDRTFIDDEGIRWIIDYKSTVADGNLEQFMENEYQKYKEKMQLYYQAIRECDGNQERGVRLALYFPAISVWKEWAPEES